MENIVRQYEEGTDFGIHMDEDGLIAAGQGFDQVTWMDVRIGDILPTPRHGKPVEINVTGTMRCGLWISCQSVRSRLPIMAA